MYMLTIFTFIAYTSEFCKPVHFFRAMAVRNIELPPHLAKNIYSSRDLQPIVYRKSVTKMDLITVLKLIFNQAQIASARSVTATSCYLSSQCS